MQTVIVCIKPGYYAEIQHTLEWTAKTMLMTAIQNFYYLQAPPFLTRQRQNGK